MKLNVGLVSKMRKERAWSQDELAVASGLNLRTVQRIEKEASASLQSVKALASVFDVNILDLEYKEATMLNELIGKKVTIVMGINESKMGGFDDNVKGEIVEVETKWLKFLEKKNLSI